MSRKQILTAFLLEFKNGIQDIHPREIIEQWKEQTSTIGSRVRVETFDKIYEGNAVDVDETGALIVEDEQKTRKKIIYGDCFHA